MILIYTQKVTPRITYTFRQVIGRILGVKIKFASKIEEFIAHSGAKFSYGDKRMGNEFFVKSAGLLTEQGTTELEITVKKWDEVACFFKVGEESDVPFDIFSAAFYLLSRYEEYLPHVKDAEGRYPVEESLGYKFGFLQEPVVDKWAYKFKEIIKTHFPDLEFPTRRFKTINILAVAEAYKYQKKGVSRNIGGAVRDLVQLRLKDFFERVHTQVFWAQDPFDIYKELLQFSRQRKIRWRYFFQLSDYSIYDKNIGYNRQEYHSLIKSMGDYGKIGLLVGHDAIYEFASLKKEKKRWEHIVNRDLKMSLKTNFGLNLPTLYNNYDTLEIGHDYSMGYVRKIGFRAGTCTPFLYYDLNLERISPLVLHPTAFNSEAFKPNSFFEVKKTVERVKANVQAVDGRMVMIYKNSDFAEGGDSQKKYYQLLENLNEY